jgi:hypothetical protein
MSLFQRIQRLLIIWTYVGIQVRICRELKTKLIFSPVLTLPQHSASYDPNQFDMMNQMNENHTMSTYSIAPNYLGSFGKTYKYAQN